MWILCFLFSLIKMYDAYVAREQTELWLVFCILQNGSVYSWLFLRVLSGYRFDPQWNAGTVDQDVWDGQ
jgi:hypothetical protein